MALEYYEKIYPSVYNHGYSFVGIPLPSGTPVSLGAHSFHYDFGNYLLGYRNSSWRDQVHNAIDASTPLVAQRRSVISRPAILVRDDFRPDANRLIATMNAPLDVDSFPSNLSSSAAQESFAKAYKIISRRSFKTGTFLGELRENIKLVRNPALALRKGISAYIKRIRKMRLGMVRNRNTVNEFRKAASDSWLEASFGWRPLINDIADATRTISSLALKPRSVHLNVTSERVQMRSLSNWQQLAGAGGAEAVFRSSATYKATSRICGAFREEGGISGLPSRFAVFPLDFVPTAWELTPWSFLIDYFTNIGDILDAVAVRSRTNFVYLNHTTRQIVNTEYEYRCIVAGYLPGTTPPSYFTIITDQPGFAHCRSKTVNRAPLSSIPIPDLKFSSALGSSKILNIGALIAGRRSDSQFSPRR